VAPNFENAPVMTFNQDIKYGTSVFCLFMAFCFFVYMGLPQLVILFTGSYFALLFLHHKNYIITTYVIFLTFGPLIHTQYNFLGLFGVDETNSIFAMVYLLRQPKFPQKKTKYQTIAFCIILSFCLSDLISIIRQYILSVSDDAFVYMFRSVTKRTVFFLPLMMLVQKIHLDWIRAYAKKGLVFGIIVICITVFFTRELTDLGFYIGHIDTYFNYEKWLRFDRPHGLFRAGGDVNSLAGFLAAFVGITLAMLEAKDVKPIIFVAATMGFLCIFLAASRTAIISMGIMAILCLKNNFKTKSFVKVVCLLTLMVLISYPFVKKSIIRFGDKSTIAAIDPNAYGSGRVGRFIYCLDILRKYPETFLFGSTIGDAYVLNAFRSPHNYFMKMIIISGVFPLILLFCAFINYSWLIVHYRLRYRLVYAFIPVFLTMSSVNSFSSSLYFIIFVSMNDIVAKKNTEI